MASSMTSESQDWASLVGLQKALSLAWLLNLKHKNNQHLWTFIDSLRVNTRSGFLKHFLLQPPKGTKLKEHVLGNTQDSAQ
jgi:hypothetical protein